MESEKEKIKKILEKNKFVKNSNKSLLRLVGGRMSLVIILVLFQVFLILDLIMKLKGGVYFGGSIAVSLVFLMIILNMDSNPYVKLSRSICIIAFPTLGVMLFLMAHFDLGYRLERRKVETIEKASNDQLHEDKAAFEEAKEEDQSFYNLATYIRNYEHKPIYKNTSAKYYPVGEDAYADMLKEIRKAKKFIFIEFFIANYGHMWGTILEELEKKVREGVEVRFMYDGTTALTRFSRDQIEDMEALGIQCRVFSPIYPIVSSYYNNRDHRKIFVVDGKVGLTGGLNLADEYINVFERFGHRKDTSIMIKGDGVQALTLMFLQLRHSQDKEEKETYDFSKYLVQYPVESEGKVIVYGDNPTDDENLAKNVYMDLIYNAKNYLWIMTPYLIIDNEVITGLIMASKRGVDVRICLPHIPDKKVAFDLAKSHYRKLIENGVKIYEYIPGFLHAKTRICDDYKGVVGTINLDYRALYFNYECAVYLYKHPVLREVYDDFQVTFSVSQEITMEDVKNMSFKTKAVGFLAKPFAPLM